MIENGCTDSQIYYDGKDYFCSVRDSIQNAISVIIKLRRQWILDELIKFKVSKANKQLRKL